MNCSFCQKVQEAHRQANPFFVGSTSTGIILLGWHQYCAGYTLFAAKKHVCELDELSWHARMQFLQDLALVAEAVRKAFEPRKLNIELLGNHEPHLHAHIFPRYGNDACPQEPVWHTDREIREAPQTWPSAERLNDLQLALQVSLQRVFYRAPHTSSLKLNIVHQSSRPPAPGS